MEPFGRALVRASGSPIAVPGEPRGSSRKTTRAWGHSRCIDRTGRASSTSHGGVAVSSGVASVACRSGSRPPAGYVYSALEDEVLGAIGHPLPSLPEEVSFSDYADALDVLEARLEALRFRAAHLQRLEGEGEGFGREGTGRSAPPPRVVVGVTGPPGCGKSTFVRALVSREPLARVALPMDGFHRPQRWLDAQRDPAEARRRRGAPFTFDGEGFADAVARAAPRGAALRAPGWDHAAADPVPDAVEVTPEHAVIFPEGNYLLLPSDPWSGIAPLCTEVWYLDVDPDQAAERLYARHVAAGHSERDARERSKGSDADNGRLVRETRNRATLAITLPTLSA